jgi:hypothetical protein
LLSENTRGVPTRSKRGPNALSTQKLDSSSLDSLLRRLEISRSCLGSSRASSPSSRQSYRIRPVGTRRHRHLLILLECLFPPPLFLRRSYISSRFRSAPELPYPWRIRKVRGFPARSTNKGGNEAGNEAFIPHFALFSLTKGKTGLQIQQRAVQQPILN